MQPVMCIANHGATRYRLWARMRLVYHVLCIAGTLWVRLCIVYCALRIAGRMVGGFVYCVLCIAGHAVRRAVEWAVAWVAARLNAKRVISRSSFSVLPNAIE